MNPFIGITGNTKLQWKAREGPFTWKVWNKLKELDDSCWVKIHGTNYGHAGVPDILGCYNGRFVGIELKRPDGKGKTSPKQKEWINKINRTGGVAAVISSLEELEDFLTKIERGDL